MPLAEYIEVRWTYPASSAPDEAVEHVLDGVALGHGGHIEAHQRDGGRRVVSRGKGSGCHAV
jgi:hypothetical protein